MFLSSADLRELTGYVRPSAQRRWLTRAGIPHHIRADGKPVVTREAVTGRLERPQPRFEALRA